MKTYITKPPGFFGKTLGAVASLVLAIAFIPGTASAETAANAVIGNTATVSFDDSAGNPQTAVTASVTVTVNLVPAVPTLASTPASQSTFSGTAVDYTYTITTNANGPDDYALSVAAVTTDVGITVNTRELRTASGGGGALLPTVNLAATTVVTNVTIPANGSNTVVVPNDGAIGGVLNGFNGGETIVVDPGGNNWVLTLDSVDTDLATGTSTITISDSTGNARNLTTGMIIAEQVTFYLYLDADSTVDAAQATERVTAQDGETVPNTDTDDTVTTINTVPNVSVTKYVRNVLNAAGNAGGAGAQAINGATYYTSGVTGNPTDTLEYVIVVSNSASSGTATDVIISDPIPEFTTYVGGSMDFDNHTAITGSGAWTSVTDVETDTDKGEFDPTPGSEEVWIYAGTLGADTGTATTYGDGTGGSLSGGNFSFGRFQVTIDN